LWKKIPLLGIITKRSSKKVFEVINQKDKVDDSKYTKKNIKKGFSIFFPPLKIIFD